MSGITIKWSVRTNIVGGRVEDSFDIDSEEWADMTPKERDELVFEIINDSGLFEWNYHNPREIERCWTRNQKKDGRGR